MEAVYWSAVSQEGEQLKLEAHERGLKLIAEDVGHGSWWWCITGAGLHEDGSAVDEREACIAAVDAVNARTMRGDV